MEAEDEAHAAQIRRLDDRIAALSHEFSEVQARIEAARPREILKVVSLEALRSRMAQISVVTAKRKALEESLFNPSKRHRVRSATDLAQLVTDAELAVRLGMGQEAMERLDVALKQAKDHASTKAAELQHAMAALVDAKAAVTGHEERLRALPGRAE